MLKLKNKWLTVFYFALILLLMYTTICGAEAEAEGFTYSVKDDNTIEITGCSLIGDIVIPKSIDGYKVTSLAAQLFYGTFGITSISIPSTVVYFGNDPEDNLWDYVFSYCYDLEKIIVADDNPVFCSVDGVLYSKDMRYLICYPPAK